MRAEGTWKAAQRQFARQFAKFAQRKAYIVENISAGGAKLTSKSVHSCI